MSIDLSNTSINSGNLSGHNNNIDTANRPNVEFQNTELRDRAKEFAKASEKVASTISEDKKEQKQQLDDAVEKLGKAATIFNRSIKFEVHEETNQTMIRVMDTENDQVIREIPGKEALDMVAKLRDSVGLIFDKFA